MFDFEHWCSWVEIQIGAAPFDAGNMSFSRGAPSSKQGATVNFETGTLVMQFAFWETGEADFYGLELATRREIVSFYGLLLDDLSFEKNFRECMSAAADQS